MDAGQTIADPVFGHLRMDYAWLGGANLQALGGRVDLEVEGAGLPTDAQRQAYIEFTKDQITLRQVLERALFEYYNGDIFLELLRQSAGCLGFLSGSGGLSKLQNSGQIWELVSDPTVTVTEAKGAELPRIKVSWECEWDPEHGVQVTLAGGKPVYTGLIGEG